MAKDELQKSDLPEDAYALDASLYDDVLDAIEAQDPDRIAALFEPLHPADIADLLEQMSHSEREALLLFWSEGIDGEVLSELDEGIREDVIDLLPAPLLAEAVRDMESDDVVDLLEDLEDADQQAAILGALDDADRAAVEEALTYPEYSAGRLMQREVVRVPEFWTVGEAIDFLRAETTELPEQFYHLILVDPRMKPVGNVTLGRLLSTQRKVALREIIEDTFVLIPVSQPEADVAYAFNQYHLISAPVVDDDGRLVGVITIDDAMIVLEDEAEEDILRLAGVGEGSLSDRVFETTRQRFPWLFVNLITAIFASLVIAQFEDTIAQFVALAVLMPIVASMGGNAGTQSLTVAVRAIATRDLTGSNLMRVVMREAGVGLINGVIFAVVMGAVGLFWFGSAALGGVIAVAMVINLVIAGLAGILIPVALDKLDIDPALASGAFVTTVTDVVGFFAFLGLAAAVLL
ncbi:magnesium transporter [Nioella sediminis]|jgi:magnesium transporter|uniref:magnesium transporter n=1 Tax=Nioella sediminis TaxID=1912092 RepID=UPI0008FD5DEC|nr:magnesium transporter [Nioella sediminis]TBX29445.1 magnesium transporter [Roseovarius sp. JS7-11]